MSDTPLVVLQPCQDYELETVRKAVRDVLARLPQASRCLQPGRSVLLKPNVVTPRGPDRPVCTHPTVVRAVAEIAHEAGCDVLVADQPTYAFAANPDETLHPTGYHDALSGLPVSVSLLGRDGYEDTTIPSPLSLRATHVARVARQADVIVNLAKCKTHVQTTLTLALKNMFGVIAPRDRMRVHARGTYMALAEALADCFSALVPQLNLTDAVVAMEGSGPTQGSPRRVGVVAASGSAVALDLVVEDLLGMPGQVGLTRAAAAKGLGPSHLNEVAIVGADPADLRTEIARPPRIFRSFPPLLGGLGERLVYIRPRVDRTKCIACGGCAEACPVSAISVKGHAVVDRGLCVECFCCMEACPADAISVQRSLLSHLVG